MDFLAGYPVLPIHRSILSRPHPLPAFTVRKECDERTGDHREDEAGEDRDPLQYIVRGNPDKPVLMVDGRSTGFALLEHVAINPHLSSAKRENELVSVIDRYL